MVHLKRTDSRRGHDLVCSFTKFTFLRKVLGGASPRAPRGYGPHSQNCRKGKTSSRRSWSSVCIMYVSLAWSRARCLSALSFKKPYHEIGTVSASKHAWHNFIAVSSWTQRQSDTAQPNVTLHRKIFRISFRILWRLHACVHIIQGSSTEIYRHITNTHLKKWHEQERKLYIRELE